MKNGQPVSEVSLNSILKKNIQNGGHDSVEDAKACMDLYQKFAYDWKNLNSDYMQIK